MKIDIAELKARCVKAVQRGWSIARAEEYAAALGADLDEPTSGEVTAAQLLALIDAPKESKPKVTASKPKTAAKKAPKPKAAKKSEPEPKAEVKAEAEAEAEAWVKAEEETKAAEEPVQADEEPKADPEAN